MTTSRTIKVDYLARVEGEGALYVKVDGDRVADVQLKIFEPPRFFEALLRGRDFREAPDITARICGICPVAYLLGAAQAMEAICGIDIPPRLRALRRLLYCGEWIESHVLHMFMLHAPDFLGYDDAVQLAKDHPELVQHALRMKKIGNRVMTLLGGREVHPINVRVGGFYRIPSTADIRALVDELKWGLDAMLATIPVLAQIAFHGFDQDYEFVALHDPAEYAITHGRVTSNKGIDVPVNHYDDVLAETHVPHSTALQTQVVGRGGAHMGPLARYNLNYRQLTPLARQAAAAAGLGASCTNPFRSLLVRGVEVVLAFEEALRLIAEYEPPATPFLEARPRAGTGSGATEAPRGICYHRYTIDDDGVIRDAKIVAPTSVNQKTIESDLRHVIQPHLTRSDDALRGLCEKAIRNYDPCISCSTHFLNLTVERT